MGLEAQHTVSHIIIMRHLYFIEQNHVLKFRGIANYRAFTHNGIATDKGTVTDLRFFINDQRTVQAGGRSYLCVLCHPDILASFFINFFRQSLTQFQNEIVDSGKHLPGIFCLGEQICRNGLLQIIQILNRNIFHDNFSSSLFLIFGIGLLCLLLIKFFCSLELSP